MSIFNQNEQYFYVGGYSSAQEPGIHLCALNIDSGRLRLVHSTSGIENPSFLIVGGRPNEPQLFAAMECEEGKVAAYGIEPSDGRLTLLRTERTDGAGPCHLSLSPSGHLLVANYSSGHVNSFELDEQGSLVGKAATIQHVGSGFRQDRQQSAHAHHVLPSKDGKYAFVSDLGLDQVIVYRLEGGKLITHREVDLPPGTGPRHFTIHPTNTIAYGINELNNTITVYAYNPTHGILEVLQHVSTLPEDFAEESYAADIHFSPDGKYLYASNRGHDSIVRFKLDESTGGLSEPEWTGAGGKWPRNFAVIHDYVIVANQFSNSIIVLRRDPATGSLSLTDGQLEVKEPSCVAVVPR
ncbi:lactonase family protein [Paenibacillus bouchesdurhonensis]|uniref:lactonase family protein n=1 Tax=Paenibacillus bouchesdurhonensis TaxID=1870990 RepID=UPI000DA5FCC5|nr:lactonase family protein [Paenibacillus bouchesdurhonensis]